MSRFRVSLPARSDVREIIRYIGIDHPQAAINWRRRLEAAFRRLAEQPGIGHARSDLCDDPTVRFWKMGRHFIVYRNHPTHGIGIARVIHTSRDIANVLSKSPPKDF